jgi:hypothetical protein
VPAAGRERERRARSRGDESPLGIEEVEQRKQVELVCAAAVQEDERPLGLARSRPYARLEAQSCTGSYFARISSMYAAIRSASSASSIWSTFSAFCSPEWERLKLPTKTVSSQTVTFACM